MWVTSVEKLAADCEARGSWREAAGYWRSLAATEPLSGRLALALIRSLAESGDLGAALQQYKIHEALMREEIGSAPEAAVSSFAESLRAGTWTRSPEPKVERRPLAAVAQSTAGGVAVTEVAPPPPMYAPSAGGETRRPSIGNLRRKHRRRSTAIAFVLGGLLVAVPTLIYVYSKVRPGDWAALNFILRRPDAIINPRRIVVARFENKTGDSSFDVVGDQIATWFARQLSEQDFDVVDERTARIGAEVVENIPQPFRNRNENIALGEETGAGYTVVGQYFRQGDSLSAEVQIIDVRDKQTVKRFGDIYGTAKDPKAFIEAIYRPTFAYLVASVDTSAGGSTTKYSEPPSPEAGRRVASAWAKFFATPGDTVGVFAELDTAARLDTTYAGPLLMKAYMLDVKSQWSGVNQIVQRVAPLEPDMSKLERLALELFESDLRGNNFARIGIAKRMQALSPASGEIPLLRVVSALYVGDVAEALAALKTTTPTRGMNVGVPTFLEWSATTYHHSGNASLEEETVREELKRFRDHPAATYQLARIYAARNDKRLDELLSKGVPASKNTVRDPFFDRMELMLFAGRELRTHGYPTEAKKIFARAVEELKSQPATTPAGIRQRARALYEAGDYLGARAAFSEMLKRDSTDVEAMARIATSAIRLGDQTTAQQMDDRLSRLKPSFPMGAPLRWRATIAAAQGKLDDAVTMLESAVRQGLRLLDAPPNLTVHLDPELAGIEKRDSYKEMLRTLADAVR